jgi:hypothetical protein
VQGVFAEHEQLLVTEAAETTASAHFRQSLIQTDVLVDLIGLGQMIYVKKKN